MVYCVQASELLVGDVLLASTPSVIRDIVRTPARKLVSVTFEDGRTRLYFGNEPVELVSGA
jgi:hypothetical protein